MTLKKFHLTFFHNFFNFITFKYQDFLWILKALYTDKTNLSIAKRWNILLKNQGLAFNTIKLLLLPCEMFFHQFKTILLVTSQNNNLDVMQLSVKSQANFFLVCVVFTFFPIFFCFFCTSICLVSVTWSEEELLVNDDFIFLSYHQTKHFFSQTNKWLNIYIYSQQMFF